jgi:hypothetical protein
LAFCKLEKLMKAFFEVIRREFGPLSQKQVDGFNVLYEASKELPVRHQAYVLATAWHETAATMQPIEEYGRGKGREYGKPVGPYGKVYFGRGYVQLTWLENYEKAGKAVDRNLVQFPDQAMIPEVAADIIVRGMSQGWFTRKKMADFQSYEDMRKVVNGTDKAALIAGYAKKMEAALLAQARADVTGPVRPDLEPPEETGSKQPRAGAGIGGAVIGAVGLLIAAVMWFIGFGR